MRKWCSRSSFEHIDDIQSDPNGALARVLSTCIQIMKQGRSLLVLTWYLLHPDNEAVFWLLAAQEAQKLQNALQKGSWRLYSGSWRLRRVRSSKMLSTSAPGGCFRAQGGSGCSEVPKWSPQGLLEAVFGLLVVQEAQKLQNAL